MKYKIRYRIWGERGLIGGVSVIEAWLFKIKKGFVSVWFEDNDTQEPDLYIKANDVLMIELLDDDI